MPKKFNLDTDRLLMMIYPHGGGGNLISVCLSIHPSVLNQHEPLARMKMKLSSSKAGEFGKKIAENLFKLKAKENKHIELNWWAPSDFDQSQTDEKPENPLALTDKLWEDLTNQDQYYFIMTEHNDRLNLWNKYKNRKNIKLLNTKWILDSRRQPINNFDETFINSNQFNFDMDSVKVEQDFLEEMQKLYHHLDLGKIDITQIKQIRENFINTFTIGWKTQEVGNGRSR